MSSAPEAPDADGAIRRLLERYPERDPPTSEAGAAVVVVLRPDATGRDVETLLIRRTERADDTASGQVALPGGRVDGSDASLRVTARREMEEEVGIGPGDLRSPLRYVGRRSAAAFGLEVGVFATALRPGGSTGTARSPSEVAEVFWLPREAVDRTTPIVRPTYLGLRNVDAIVHRQFVVWGFTRRVLRTFFGYEDPSDGNPRPPAVAAERR